MLLNIGCDTGYGYTMSSSKIGESRFSSYIERIEDFEAENIRKNLTDLNEDSLLVKYNKEYYILGRLCEKQYMDATRYVRINRVGDTLHLIQLLTSIALNAKVTSNIDVNLMVGLPVRSEGDREAFSNWLTDTKHEITFLTKDKDYTKVINVNKCFCSLQPLFPIFSAIGKENAKGKNILSLDVGYSSTDGVRYEDDSMSKLSQDQIDLEGAKKIQDSIESQIKAKYKGDYMHLAVTERSLQMALETGLYFINGEQVDISEILDNVFESYAGYLFKEVQRRYTHKLSDIDIVLVSGGLGCSENFMKRLAGMFKDYKITVATSNEPQWDICRGMHIFLNMGVSDSFDDNEKGEVSDKSKETGEVIDSE